MNKSKNKKKQTFWTWLHENRIRVFLWAFLIIVPLTLVLVSYVGSYTRHSKVHFDEKVTSETVVVNKFEDPSSLKPLNLIISWEVLRHPDYVESSDAYYNGYYQFNIRYQPKPNYQINSVYITPVLQTDWINIRSLGQSMLIYRTDQPMQIGFDYMLPRTPLLFVKVEEPNLYLRVSVSITYSGVTTEQLYYVKYNLKGINPNTILN